MDSVSILILLTLFALKHFVADFILQTPYQFLNKGKYGHLGGILHSWIQALGTLIVLSPFAPPLMVLAMTVFDFVIHYHVDWAKVQINQRFGWDANKHKEFWWLLGLDQLLHSLTYLAIVAILVFY